MLVHGSKRRKEARRHLGKILVSGKGQKEKEKRERKEEDTRGMRDTRKILARIRNADASTPAAGKRLAIHI